MQVWPFEPERAMFVDDSVALLNRRFGLGKQPRVMLLWLPRQLTRVDASASRM
jgi:hypothetical protein